MADLLSSLSLGNSLLGLFSITLVSLLTWFIALRWPDISKIILVALIARLTLLVIGHFIDLPDSGSDAENFEDTAWRYAQNGFFNVLGYFTGPDPFFISWIIAVPYSLMDRSELMAQSISLLFGLGSVVLGWLVANKIWNKDISNKVGWAIALFPTLILYSVLTLREVYVVFFLLMALYYIVIWTKTDSLASIILAMIGFFGATCFHGAMFVGGIVFLAIVVLSNIKKLFKSFRNFKLNYKILILILLIISSGLYVSDNVYIPYLETFNYATDFKVLLHKTQINTSGAASWPEWTIMISPMEIIYKLPVRSLYFVFAPFPWQVTEFRFFVGMFDAVLYMYLSFLIFKNRKNIWKDPALRIILIILVFYILVFAIGVGNFGTGIRHRSKFTVLFILLAAPMLKKFVLKKN